MNSNLDNASNEFLMVHGEMAKLIREYDWSKTAVGSIDNWELSLRTTVGIVLNSKFPKFLFWGDDLICFYNDAYRPSLGQDGKHPGILGKRGEEAWTEIWDIIKPFIDQVSNGGGSTWSENQLIPIFRNGQIEDAYWTFSYSAVTNDKAKVNGILVTCFETTDKVNTLRELEESNSQLEFAIEAAELGTFDFNPVSGLFRSNNRLKEIFGLPQKENLDLKQGLQVIVEKDVDRVMAALQKSMEYASGGKYDIQYTILNPVTFNEHIVHAKGLVSFDAKKNPYKLTGTVQDITQQAIAQTSIETSEKFNRTVLESSPDCLKVIDSEGRVQFMNENGCQLMEVDDFNQIKNQYWWEMWGEENKDKIKQIFKESLNGNAAHFNAYCPTLKGTGKWWDVVISAANTNKEGQQQVIAVSRDITEQKKAEEQILKTATHLQLATDSANVGTWSFDVKTEKLDWSALHKTMWGYDENTEGLVYSDWHSIIIAEDLEKAFKMIEQARINHSLYKVEYRIKRFNDGAIRWMKSEGKYLYDDNGDALTLNGISIDITEQKNFTTQLEIKVRERTEELAYKTLELEKANKTLEITNENLNKMNKELQSFAYISSHDLQEPLRKIQIFASRLTETEKDNLSENGNYLFKRMQAAAERMQSLIDDLLAYSRTHNSEQDYQKTNLNEVIEQVSGDLYEEIEQQNATIENHRICEINVIPFQFQQLFYNLISNSLKFSSPNRPLKITINGEHKIGSELTDSTLLPSVAYCHITYTDNGIGFEPQYSERIFELFKKLHPNSEYKGTGIGLAIVKKIIENHNGTITAKGVLGKGATFDIYLPVTKV
jgi:PAS domain S-box-containing protein